MAPRKGGIECLPVLLCADIGAILGTILHRELATLHGEHLVLGRPLCHGLIDRDKQAVLAILLQKGDDTLGKTLLIVVANLELLLLRVIVGIWLLGVARVVARSRLRAGERQANDCSHHHNK